MPAERTYPSITTQKWQEIRSAVFQYGISIASDQGQCETFGVRFKWQYSPDQSLRVCILQSGLLSEREALKFLDNIIANA